MGAKSHKQKLQIRQILSEILSALVVSLVALFLGLQVADVFAVSDTAERKTEIANDTSSGLPVVRLVLLNDDSGSTSGQFDQLAEAVYLLGSTLTKSQCARLQVGVSPLSKGNKIGRHLEGKPEYISSHDPGFREELMNRLSYESLQFHEESLFDAVASFASIHEKDFENDKSVALVVISDAWDFSSRNNYDEQLAIFNRIGSKRKISVSLVGQKFGDPITNSCQVDSNFQAINSQAAESLLRGLWSDEASLKASAADAQFMSFVMPRIRWPSALANAISSNPRSREVMQQMVNTKAVSDPWRLHRLIADTQGVYAPICDNAGPNVIMAFEEVAAKVLELADCGLMVSSL